jgi:hypothetical protein
MVMGEAWEPWRGEPGITVGEPNPTIQAVVRSQAARAAAWLARRFRAELRRDRAFHLKLSAVAREPAWFGLAMQEFSRRRGWRVTTTPAGTWTFYRVERT